MPPNLAANTIRLYEFPKIEIRQLLPADEEALARETRKVVKDMPLIQLLESSHRGGCPAMAGEPIHPHARIHQVNPQRRCGHRRGLVAFERVRALSLVISDPRRNFADPVEQVSHIAEDVT
jgi:hypothetical protein